MPGASGIGESGAELKGLPTEHSVSNQGSNPSEGLPFEERLSRQMCLFAAGAGVLAMGVNALAGSPPLQYLLAGFAVLLGGGCYLASWRWSRVLWPRLVLFGGFALLLVSVWLTNEGLAGSTVIWLMAYSGLHALAFPLRHWLFTVVAPVVFVAALVRVEQVRPQWILAYVTPAARSLDLVLVLLAGTGLLSFVAWRTAEEFRLERQRTEALRKAAEERELALETALAEIRRLEGLLPICSFCKKIRDEEGHWQPVEAYISERSETEFSHGICPSCRRSEFADLDDVPG